jgi:hypothetical protein
MHGETVKNSWVYCNMRGDYMFRLSGKVKIFRLQQCLVISEKKMGSQFIILCRVITQAIIVWAAPAVTTWTFVSFYRYIWFFFCLETLLKSWWLLDGLTNSLSYMNLNVRYGSTEFRHCTLTYRQINPFHFLTPRSLRHFIYCNTNLRVDSVQLWSHGDYPWCLTVAAADVLWPLFLESKNPRIFTASASMIPHFTLSWNFWNPKSLQQFAGNIGGWIFHIISAVWPNKTGDFRWSHLLLYVIESAWGKKFCGHNYCFVLKQWSRYM